jgi:site-specific recombinase XerC
MGNKHAQYRVLRAFFHWLYSPRSDTELNPQDNPMLHVEPPKVPKLILPTLAKDQVELLIAKADDERDKAIIALFTESWLRLSELTNMRPEHIDWSFFWLSRYWGKVGKKRMTRLVSYRGNTLQTGWANINQPGTSGDLGLEAFSTCSVP